MSSSSGRIRLHEDAPVPSPTRARGAPIQSDRGAPRNRTVTAGPLDGEHRHERAIAMRASSASTPFSSAMQRVDVERADLGERSGAQLRELDQQPARCPSIPTRPARHDSRASMRAIPGAGDQVVRHLEIERRQRERRCRRSADARRCRHGRTAPPGRTSRLRRCRRSARAPSGRTIIGAGSVARRRCARRALAAIARAITSAAALRTACAVGEIEPHAADVRIYGTMSREAIFTTTERAVAERTARRASRPAAASRAQNQSAPSESR